MFTVEQRDALRRHVLTLAEADERVVAGAVVGSLSVDAADRFSDLDLTFGIAAPVPISDVLDDWTRTLVDELDAFHLADLERGPTIYRVFLLPDALQFDLSMTPATRFRPAGPRFRLLFGETAASEAAPPATGTCSSRRRASHDPSSDGASSTRSTRARASSGAVSGRPSITSAPCATTRSPSPAATGGSPGAGAQLRRSARGQPRSTRGCPCRDGRAGGAAVGTRRLGRRAHAGRRGGGVPHALLVAERLAELRDVVSPR